MLFSTAIEGQGALFFSFWVLDSRWQFFLSCLIVASLSYGNELLYEHRAKLHATPSSLRLKTFFYCAQLALGTVTMLVTMTMNVWLILSVIVGAGIGFYQHADKRLSMRNNTNNASSHCDASIGSPLADSDDLSRTEDV
jgi:hypothetical protein